jgi:hypothetical protein
MIYTGKTDGPQEEIDSAAGYGHKLVLNLIRCLPAQGTGARLIIILRRFPWQRSALRRGLGCLEQFVLIVLGSQLRSQKKNSEKREIRFGVRRPTKSW